MNGKQSALKHRNLQCSRASLRELEQTGSRLIDELQRECVAVGIREGVGRLRVLIIAIIESVLR